MAKKKLKKKSSSRKASAPAKRAKPSARTAKAPGGAADVDEASATLRASAKTFAFRLLR